MSAHRDIAQRIIRETFPTRWQAWPDGNGPDCALALVVEDDATPLEADRLWVVTRIETPKHGRETFAIHAPSGRIFGREVPGSSGSNVRSWKLGDLPTHMRGDLSAPVRGCIKGGPGAISTLHPTLVRVLDPEAEADAKKRARAAQKDVPVSKANGAPSPAATFSRPAPAPPPSLVAKSAEESRVTVVQVGHKVEISLAQLLALVRYASGEPLPDNAVARVVWSDRPEEPAMGPHDRISVRWTTTREE